MACRAVKPMVVWLGSIVYSPVRSATAVLVASVLVSVVVVLRLNSPMARIP